VSVCLSAKKNFLMVEHIKKCYQKVAVEAQIREQMVVPDLYVFTLKFHSNFSPKKNGFSEKKKISPKKKKKIPFLYATFQCGRYGVFKKKLKYFFGPEKVKKPERLS
jgi:hypothetical protein